MGLSEVMCRHMSDIKTENNQFPNVTQNTNFRTKHNPKYQVNHEKMCDLKAAIINNSVSRVMARSAMALFVDRPVY